MQKKAIFASVVVLGLLSCFIALAYAGTATTGTLTTSAASHGAQQNTFGVMQNIYVYWTASPSGSTVDLTVTNIVTLAVVVNTPGLGDSGEVVINLPVGTYQVAITGAYPAPLYVGQAVVQVVPELPLIGTAGASIAMIGGLAYKLKRKKL